MAEIMFGTFDVPFLCVANRAAMVLQSLGVQTGLVLECGDGATYVTPLVKGSAIEKAVERSELAGRDITEFLMKSVKDGWKNLADKEGIE